MPKLMNIETETFAIVGSNNSFKFSGASIDKLGADKYTLAVIAVDCSGSVISFKKQLEDTIATVIEACKKCPNLMIRVIFFDSSLSEIHGFINIEDTDTKDYKLNPGGCTNLFGAAYDAVGSVVTYAKALSDQDFGVNGICFVITDGGDTEKRILPSKIKDLKEGPIVSEDMQSFISILVGITRDGSSTNAELTKFKDDAGFDHYENINDASPASLAKLGQLISRSISQTSRSLQTGSGSKNLTW
jgi:hypothetical protein